MVFLSAFLLVVAISIDCLAAGFAYGANKIKLPFISVMIINFVCTGILAISLFLGEFVGNYISEIVTTSICAGILTIMGLYKIISSFCKGKGLLNNPEKADKDKNKVLSKGEAFFMSIALSLDCIAAGLGAGMANDNYIYYLIVIGLSLIINAVFIMFGSFVGRKLLKKNKMDLSWLSGLVLIGIAIMNFFI